MKPFEYQRPATVAAASAALDDRHLVYAGGTDLLTRVKAGLEVPDGLIDVKASGLSGEIVDHGDRITIGALVTLADIERSPLLHDRSSALVEAARLAATPQIRNRATIAGNLVQRPRCWYYRTTETDCWLKGGHDCPAIAGRNEHHAIFTGGPCVAVHPSDLAGALVAFDATVHLHGRDGARQLPIEDLFAEPTEDRRRETTVAEGEIITGVEIDSSQPMLSTYRKAMDRAAWAFALVGVAASVDLERPARVRIVLTGVANIPHRARESERILSGDEWSDDAIERAAAAVVAGAAPLSDNRYKQQLAIALTRDAIDGLRALRDTR